MSPRKRWSVRVAFWTYGWGDPIYETDDPANVISVYEKVADAHRMRRTRHTLVAIFDDNGEGEPLDADSLRERMREELWDFGLQAAAENAPDDELAGLYQRMRAVKERARMAQAQIPLIRPPECAS